jgi:hypothetical protein
MMLMKAGAPRSLPLFLLGVMAVVMGILLRPSFIVEHFHPAGIRARSTVLEILASQALLVMIGLALSGYAVLRHANRPYAERIEKAATANNVVIFGIGAAVCVIVAASLLYDIERIRYTTPINPNEGWNVFHTSQVLRGEPLYTPPLGFPTIPVNYPPLSFLIIGALGFFTGDLLGTGRWVALLSFLFVGFLTFRIVETLTSHRAAAGLAALLWLGLIVGRTNEYVAMDDPQMLGHAFSVGGLLLYARWSNRLTLPRIIIVALLCSLGVFVKHLLIAVPITLAIVLLVRDRKRFGVFVLAGTGILAVLILGTWLLAGNDFFKDLFVEAARESSMARMLDAVNLLMIDRFGLVFLVAFAALLAYERDWDIAQVYLPTAFLVGSVASSGAGVNLNAWFDFFVAASIVSGLLAAKLTTLRTRGSRIVTRGILLACLLPVCATLKLGVDDILNRGELGQQEQIYRKDVELLHSIPGPALFEPTLLGFAAGKDFQFDPFMGGQLIATGRLPERVLTDRIRRKYFGAIVLSTNLDEERMTGVWPRSVIDAIGGSYELLEVDRPRYGYFYVPRKH